MKRTILILMFISCLALPAFAQPENFRVGETVETSDGRVCKILTITGRSAKVACGANRSDIRVYSFESMTSERAAQAKREQLEKQRQNDADTPRPQKEIFRTGDAVIAPDGRTGKIESFKDDEMAKVRFGANETQYFMLPDLKKAPDPSKPTFRVGDRVFKDGQPGVVETIERNGYKVRFGTGKYDWSYATADSLMTPQQAAQEQERARQEQIQKPLRAQFMDEAQAFSSVVYKLAPVFNPKYLPIGTGITQETRTYEAWRRDLESLDAICRKYPNMTNPSMDSIYQGDIKFFPADWCSIAAQRTEVLQKTKRTVGDKFAESDIQSWTLKIKEALDDPNGNVADEVQTLLYERPVWDQKHLAAMNKHYLDAGVVSPELLRPLDQKVAELKAKIEQDALNRSWTQPNFKEAALEALGKREVVNDFPGAKVFKAGMTYTNWEVRDRTTYIGSDSKFRFYRITPGAYRYKRGLVLVQLPNRPFCQIREFQVTQYKAGAGYGAAKASGSLAGIIVKCP